MKSSIFNPLNWYSTRNRRTKPPSTYAVRFHLNTPTITFSLRETNIPGISFNNTREWSDIYSDRCREWLSTIEHYERVTEQPTKEHPYMIVEMTIIGAYKMLLHIERIAQYGAYIYVINSNMEI